MTREQWQRRRADWMEKEKAERSQSWQASHPNIQTAVTEQAIRELYDRVEALEKKPEAVTVQSVLTNGKIRQ